MLIGDLLGILHKFWHAWESLTKPSQSDILIFPFFNIYQKIIKIRLLLLEILLIKESCNLIGWELSKIKEVLGTFQTDWKCLSRPFLVIFNIRETIQQFLGTFGVFFMSGHTHVSLFISIWIRGFQFLPFSSLYHNANKSWCIHQFCTYWWSKTLTIWLAETIWHSSLRIKSLAESGFPQRICIIYEWLFWFIPKKK